MSVYRDIVIAQFADDERQLLERLASVEDDRAAYRELAQRAIDALARETRAHAITRDELAREREQSRWLRASLLTKAA